MLSLITLITYPIIINGEVSENIFICNNNDASCGRLVTFNDVNGLNKIVPTFEAEYLLQGATFDGGAWIKDKSYPQKGYYLFTVFGTGDLDVPPPFFPVNPESSGLWRLFFDLNDEMHIEQIINLPGTADTAYDFKNAPNLIFLTSEITSIVYIVDISTNTLSGVISDFNGLGFVSPNGIYADGKGNIFFTDPDLGISAEFGPPTNEGGRIYRVDLKDNNKVYNVVNGTYGFVGIDGKGNKIVAGNTVDLPPGEYGLFDFDQTDRSLISIERYKRLHNGKLEFMDIFYNINDDPEYFQDKIFLDGISLDYNGNVWMTVNTNLTFSKLSIVNDKKGYIGEIVFDPEYQVVSVDYGDDGYFYVGMTQFLQGVLDGRLVRIPTKRARK